MASSSGGSAKERIVLARRPGFGSLGQKTMAVSNHYRVKFEPKVLYHYDVTIQSIGLKDSNKAIPKSLNREVMNEFIVQHIDKLGTVLPVYDGEKSLYTATTIPDLDVEVQLPESNGSGSRCKRRSFLVAVKKASEPDLRLLDRFLKGEVSTFPQEGIQALDIVLRELPSQKLVPAGRSFFSDIFGQHDLGGGIISWNGFYESIRVAQNGLLTLNLDITANAFIKPGSLEDFLSNSFRMDRTVLFEELTRGDACGDTARVKAKKLLKGIRIETNHSTKTKRKHRVSSLSDQPLQSLTFEMNGENISVCEYFSKTYNYKIRYPQLPAIDCGTRDKRTYFPIEVCSIVPGQNYTRKMNQSQKDALTKITCCMPQDRLQKTHQIAQDLISNSSRYLKEFGVMVNRNMTEVPARVLPPPKIQFKNSVENPSNGSWNLRGKVLFQACKRIKAWSLINFDNMLYPNTINKFCNEFVRSCTNYGLVSRFECTEIQSTK
ncbi:hypothetical protein O6H91_20G006800 [Diphasiastrum complanatum]|uniref:Uncharacterized protein n=2 Tax=Diphasiastrum complanatum TaxID=34168 RepID=A0ACC2AMH3_DIPCM|nr:hypothetical protein O6H91_20G006800 [Diphasiastrum complanatum]